MNKWEMDLILKEQIYNTRRWIEHYRREKLNFLIYFGLSTILVFFTFINNLKTDNIETIDKIYWGIVFLLCLVNTILLYKMNRNYEKSYEDQLKEKEENYNKFLKDGEE